MEFPKHPFRTHGGAAVPHHKNTWEHPHCHHAAPGNGSFCPCSSIIGAPCVPTVKKGDHGLCGHCGGRQRRLCQPPRCTPPSPARWTEITTGDAHRRTDDPGRGGATPTAKWKRTRPSAPAAAHHHQGGAGRGGPRPPGWWAWAALVSPPMSKLNVPEGKQH